MKGRPRRYLWGETGSQSRGPRAAQPLPGERPCRKKRGKDGPSRSPVLTVKNVSYWYGAKRALDDVSFEVYPGRVTALLGPNGAGKTTLFSLITRLFDAPTGRIEICGKRRSEWGAQGARRRSASCSSSRRSTSTSRSSRTCAISRRCAGSSAKRPTSAWCAALEALDMAERIGERVRSLNGGHRRRVEIARSSAAQPEAAAARRADHRARRPDAARHRAPRA